MDGDVIEGVAEFQKAFGVQKQNSVKSWLSKCFYIGFNEGTNFKSWNTSEII